MRHPSPLALPPRFPIPSTPRRSSFFAARDIPPHHSRQLSKDHKQQLIFSSPLPLLSTSIHHGRKKRKVLVLVATAFILFCIVFLSQQLSLQPPPPLRFPRLKSSAPRHKDATEVVLQRPKTSYAYAQRKQIELTAPQELAALVQFIASPSIHSLPLDVDPSLPLDPQLICPFDTRSDRAVAEIDQLVTETWTHYPVILFKKQLSPVGREVREMIDDLNLAPPPIIIDVDTREDLPILSPILGRLTAAQSLPILLVGGELAAPTISGLRALKTSGELKTLVEKAGAKVGGGKKRKGKKK